MAESAISDPSGEEKDENMSQKMGLLAFIGSVGTNGSPTHDLVVEGLSPAHPTEDTR